MPSVIADNPVPFRSRMSRQSAPSGSGSPFSRLFCWPIAPSMSDLSVKTALPPRGATPSWLRPARASNGR
eukprot:15204592-Alexandrium_andersonii.AAC.1